MAFSCDGSTVASGGVDGAIQLFNIPTGKHERTCGPGEGWRVMSIAFAPDGITLAIGTGMVGMGRILLWDMYSDRHMITLEGHTDYVTCLAFSPQGFQLLSGSSDRTIRLWDAKPDQILQYPEEHRWKFDEIDKVAFSPDGSTIAGHGSLFEKIELWDAHTGEHRHTLKHIAMVYSIAFSPDGRTIAIGGGYGIAGALEDVNTIHLWHTATGEQTLRFTGHTDTVTSITFSPDGETVASGSSDGTIRLWDAISGAHMQTLTGHTSNVTSVTFNPVGDTLASGSHDGTILLWDVSGE